MWARSYTLRALLAILLLVGYYVVALGLALGLLALPFGLLATTRFVGASIKLALVGLVAGGTILWSLVPRRAKWEPPGPLLTEAEQPRLFAIIRDVATRMNSPMPSEVYLIPDVNAFVTQRGGVLGFGGQRVMGIGLGLLAVDNVSQLRATLAHEFGHFEGGETKLSGLTYATRAAMARTLENLRASGSTVLHKPFEWMLILYMRLTQAISRQQELVADEWSVKLEGKTAHLTGLEQEVVHGFGFHFFMSREVEPLAQLGVGPANLFEGYRRFLTSSSWQKAQGKVAEELGKREPDPYDSHPGHEERLAFARALPLPDKPMDTTPSFTLLENAEALEQRFTTQLRPQSLKPVSWSEVGASWGELWQSSAARVAARVPDFSVASLATLMKDAAAQERFAESINPRLLAYRRADRQEQVQMAAVNYSAAYLACVLSRHGFEWYTAPGEPVMLKRGEVSVDPRGLVQSLQKGEVGPEALEKLMADTGLAPSARWEVKEEARKEALAAPAEVTVEAGPKGAQVRARFQPLALPQCCLVCLGPAEYELEQHFQVNSGGNELSIGLPLISCEKHRAEVTRAMHVEAYDRASDRVTLRVTNPELATLIQKANA
jgi:Zn-dependent protease with chaperone function